MKFLLGILFLLACNCLIYAQLDFSFRLLDSSGIIRDSAVQKDNKIVSVGGCRTINGPFPICLMRLSESGTLDSTFGVGGYRRTSITGLNTNLEYGSLSVGIQNDDKIVVLVFGAVSGIQNFLYRYNANGSLDTGFGNQGSKVLSTFQGFRSSEMQIQPDGKIVVIGGPYIARYLPDGNTDTDFGTNGVVTLNVNGFNPVGNALELRFDGKLVVGGERGGSGFIGRLNANGTLDTAFGDNGYQVINGSTEIRSLSVSANNKMVALSTENIIYRLNADGSLDMTFDSDGSRQVFGANNVYIANDILVTPSGKITVVGNRLPVNSGVSLDYMAARFNLNGSPDTTFSGSGLFEFNIYNVDSPKSVVFDRYGKAVIAGLSAQGSVANPYDTPYFSIARLIAPPAQNVSVSGRLIDSRGRPVINGFLVLKNDSSVIAETRTNPFGYFRFKNISAPNTYTISPRSKGLTYYEQDILVDAELSDIQIAGQ